MIYSWTHYSVLFVVPDVGEFKMITRKFPKSDHLIIIKPYIDGHVVSYGKAKLTSEDLVEIMSGVFNLENGYALRAYARDVCTFRAII